MNPPESDPDPLRRIAELRLKERSASGVFQSEDDVRRMQHELQVYQIELEMQNEELVAARGEIESSLKRYADLFDNAPASYFNLNPEGLISDVNLAGSRLIGIEKQQLQGRKFGLFLAETDRPSFTEILADIFATGIKRSSDLTIIRDEGTPCKARAEATLSSDGEECRLILVDLTAKNLSDEKLRLSDLALKAISQGVIITGVDKRIRWSNDAFESITGYSKSEILGQTCHFVQGELTDPKTVAAIRHAVMSGTDFHGNILNYRKNGDVFWNELSISPIRNEHGELTHFIGVIRDITRRKRSEEAKKDSDERLKFAMKASNIGLWDWDFQTNQVRYSREWKNQLGYDEDEMKDEYYEWERRVHPLDFAFAAEVREKYLKREIPNYNVEFRMIHKDGSWRWINARGEVLCDNQGKQIGMLGCHIDITEQKRAVESLQLMKFCVDRTADAVFWISREGRILYVNDSVCKERGYSREQLLGMSIFDLDVNPEYQQDSWKKHFEELKHRGTITLETRHRTKDGRLFPIEINANYVHIGDKELNFAFGRDITERKLAEDERHRLELQILHTQKLESLGVLAGGIAHDFNNLLTAILGHASLARMELPHGSSACSSLEEIEKAARNAADLTNQMLAYSGKGRFVIEPLRLDALVHEMITLLKTVVSKKVRILTSLEPSLFDGDATQARQVIMNLITNASDAFEGNEGEIHVRTGIRNLYAASLVSRFVPESLPEGPYAFLEIEDNGCGMSEETLLKIFDPFFSTKTSGRGLGLAAVLGIIRGHCGTIKVESEPGKGTRFLVLFPAISAMAPKDSGQKEINRCIGDGTILIVDDEIAVRRFLQKCLEKAGFSVLSAADGREGLDVFDQHSAEISAVLLDLTMPYMNGLEVLKELRRRSANVPVLMMSGFSELDVSTQMTEAENCVFIQKPFSTNALVTRICQLTWGSKDK